MSSLERRASHAHCVEVESLTVDSLGLHGVGFVKMDADGAKAAALRSAAELLRRDRPALLVELESRLGPIGPAIDLLTGQRYAGWVLTGRRWVPLAGFDLVGHQARTEHLVHQGLLRRAFTPRGARYVNSVLFLPEGRAPGGTAA